MKPLHASEIAALDLLRRAKAARDAQPEADLKPVLRPEKYANPLGMDTQGNLFLEPDDDEDAQ